MTDEQTQNQPQIEAKPVTVPSLTEIEAMTLAQCTHFFLATAYPNLFFNMQEINKENIVQVIEYIEQSKMLAVETMAILGVEGAEVLKAKLLGVLDEIRNRHPEVKPVDAEAIEAALAAVQEQVETHKN